MPDFYATLFESVCIVYFVVLYLPFWQTVNDVFYGREAFIGVQKLYRFYDDSYYV